MGYRILVGQPSSGVIHDCASEASWLVSLRHRCDRLPSCGSGNNFNTLLVNAMNYGEQGKITHHAQVHSDIRVVKDGPAYRWGDVMIEEMDRLGLVFCCAAVAIKGPELLVSCGIGDPKTEWNPWRRFTTKELKKLPETFTADMIGYGDKYLLVNHGLCMFDMRWPGWYQTDEKGEGRFDFNFADRIFRDPVSGLWTKQQSSDDWHFSRQLWKAGARAGITSKIKVHHLGGLEWSNKDDGIWEHDMATYENWKNDPELATAP